MTEAEASNASVQFYFKNFGDAERSDIEDEILIALADVQAGRYDDELNRVGIKHGDLTQARDVSYDVEVGQHLTGVEWELIKIVVSAVTGAVAKVLLDILLRRLQQRYGSSRVSTTPPERK